VWQARDERLHREVAVKLLPRERIAGGRFEREARAAARLAHPGIVTLHEASVDDDGAYLVSELVVGATFDQLLDAGRLSDRDIVTIGIALCDALAHAHAQGVVHRDVKPSNVLIPERPATLAEVAKLTDFGVARLLVGDSLTRTGDVLGTAAYMAPEQAEGRTVAATADLYSLALVIYEALTGVNPLTSTSPAHRARRLGTYLPPLRRQRRDLPRVLGHGIDLALRPRPRERGSIEELRSALSLAADVVDDRPGVVAGPWRARSNDHAEWADAGHEPPADDDADPKGAGPAALTPAWLPRALAAATAAGLTAWLATHVLARSPLAPAAAALMAGLLIAALPRLGWITLTATVTATLVLQHLPGAALLVSAGALVPMVVLLGNPTAWPLAAVAPALGALGLAGAWPALASRAGGARSRAALGLTGWTWLVLAEGLANKGLYTRRPDGLPAPSVWMHSLPGAAAHVLSPLLSGGVLLVAPVWAAAAVVLPLIRSRRSLLLDAVLVAIWTATLAAATASVVALGGRATIISGDGVLGALAAGTVALAPNVTKRWRATAIRRTMGRDLRSMESP
jgi:eukaryotic-like serine/threonine-protein kinase